MARRTSVVVAGALLGGALYWRRHPSACPYAARFSLDFLRPGLGPPRLIEALEPGSGERVLEIGPGTGHYTLPVASRVARLDAFDLQPEMLRSVERRALAEGVDTIVTRQGDARSLPYEDESFDAVFMVTVLGEVPDVPAALSEVRRVLRPGGRAVFGEIVLDPHVVTAGTLRRRCEAAGLRWVRRHGSPLAFFARVERPRDG
jgi:ubiquinone/menaquinone biosynthesis C-methylase UbiE